jgi:hypothetical protein
VVNEVERMAEGLVAEVDYLGTALAFSRREVAARREAWLRRMTAYIDEAARCAEGGGELEECGCVTMNPGSPAEYTPLVCPVDQGRYKGMEEGVKFGHELAERKMKGAMGQGASHEEGHLGGE